MQTIEEESRPPLSSAEDGRVRPQPAPHGLPEDVAEVLFVFRVRLVADARRRAEAPEALDQRPPIPNADELPRWHFADFEIRRQMGIGVMRQVSSDVVIIDAELVVREQHQRTEVGRPQDSVFLQVVEDVPDGHVVGGEE
jgi:hypothetical protein